MGEMDRLGGTANVEVEDRGGVDQLLDLARWLGKRMGFAEVESMVAVKLHGLVGVLVVEILRFHELLH